MICLRVKNVIEKTHQSNYNIKKKDIFYRYRYFDQNTLKIDETNMNINKFAKSIQKERSFCK